MSDTYANETYTATSRGTLSRSLPEKTSTNSPPNMKMLMSQRIKPTNLPGIYTAHSADGKHYLAYQGNILTNAIKDRDHRNWRYLGTVTKD